MTLDGAHRALVDARATAQLLLAVADALDDGSRPATARPLAVTPINVLTRDGQPTRSRRRRTWQRSPVVCTPASMSPRTWNCWMRRSPTCSSPRTNERS